jgi:hypothetical protein
VRGECPSVQMELADQFACADLIQAWARPFE